MSIQQENLDRVKANIGEHVSNFVKERWATGQRKFAMRELHDYIFRKTQIAPASPDRILRQLRLDGECDYRVVNRRKSLYEIIGVGTEGSQYKLDKIKKPKQFTITQKRSNGELIEKFVLTFQDNCNLHTIKFYRPLIFLAGDEITIE